MNKKKRLAGVGFILLLALFLLFRAPNSEGKRVENLHSTQRSLPQATQARPFLQDPTRMPGTSQPARGAVLSPLGKINLDRTCRKKVDFIEPVKKYDRISSEYGLRWGNDFHTGLDYATDIGVEVYAIADATVVWTETVSEKRRSGQTNGFGNRVVYQLIDLPILVDSAHLDKVLVKPGQFLKQGELLAKTGDTGFGTGPHYHMGFHIPSKWYLDHTAFGRLAYKKLKVDFNDKSSRAVGPSIDPRPLVYGKVWDPTTSDFCKTG